jgi:dTMP kinase
MSSVGDGRFVVFEGIDGSGKSTQARLAAQSLRAAGRVVVETREPGGTVLGERLRAVLLDAGTGTLAGPAEVALFAAARAQLVAEVIAPARSRGDWVVCDRFLASSLAYQGVGRGLGIGEVRAANALAVDGCMPDLTIVVDVPLAIAEARRGRGDRIEAEGADFHARVADGYREIAAADPTHVRTVDGSGTPPEVHARVAAILAELA